MSGLDPTAEELAWIGVGGALLCGTRFPPAGKPKATVALAHGINDHSGRYRHVIDAFVARVVAVYAIDHRGHGRSAGDDS